jgi:hypothetical protein
MIEDKNLQLGAILTSIVVFFTCVLNFNKWIRFKRYVKIKLFRGEPSFIEMSQRYNKLTKSEREVAVRVLKSRFNITDNQVISFAGIADIYSNREYFIRENKELHRSVFQQGRLIDNALIDVRNLKNHYTCQEKSLNAEITKLKIELLSAKSLLLTITPNRKRKSKSKKA